MKEMSTCNRLGLETLGYRLVMLKNLPKHCFGNANRIPFVFAFGLDLPASWLKRFTMMSWHAELELQAHVSRHGPLSK